MNDVLIYSSRCGGDDIQLIETFNILLLNRSNRVMGMVTISKGGVSGTVVDAKMVFASELKCRASSIFLAHNHPSGNLTKKLKAGGKLLDISVLDHLIVTKEDYYSFADEGMM